MARCIMPPGPRGDDVFDAIEAAITRLRSGDARSSEPSRDRILAACDNIARILAARAPHFAAHIRQELAGIRKAVAR